MSFRGFRTIYLVRTTLLAATIFAFCYLVISSDKYATMAILLLLIAAQVYSLLTYVESSNRQLQRFLESNLAADDRFGQREVLFQAPSRVAADVVASFFACESGQRFVLSRAIAGATRGDQVALVIGAAVGFRRDPPTQLRGHMLRAQRVQQETLEILGAEACERHP